MLLRNASQKYLSEITLRNNSQKLSEKSSAAPSAPSAHVAVAFSLGTRYHLQIPSCFILLQDSKWLCPMIHSVSHGLQGPNNSRDWVVTAIRTMFELVQQRGFLRWIKMWCNNNLIRMSHWAKGCKGCIPFRTPSGIHCSAEQIEMPMLELQELLANNFEDSCQSIQPQTSGKHSLASRCHTAETQTFCRHQPCSVVHSHHLLPETGTNSKASFHRHSANVTM